MEKENLIKRLPRTNKRVSLFKKRKKPQERQIVRLHNQRNYKKLLLNFAIVIIIVSILLLLLFIVRFVVVPRIFQDNRQIIVPQANQYPDNNQVKNVIQNSGLEISNINIATNASTVSFIYSKNIQVMLSTRKDIRGQMDLVEAIEKQVESEGKRAIYIDLRYNKPIVKF